MAKISSISIVRKIGLVFEDGRVYSIEEHDTERGRCTKLVDVTKELAKALREEQI